jgi:O-antigen/teichoic acid export membrane protein
MTPYLLARLGIERFGVWALLGAAVGIVGLCDLGVRNAVVRYLAGDLEVPGRPGEARSILSTSFYFYLGFSLVVGSMLLVVRERLLALLGIPPELRHEAAAAFPICVLSFLVTQLLAVFPAVCDARRRMDLMNGLGVLSLLVSTALTVVAVERGGGLPAIALAQLFGVVLYHTLAARVARRMSGPLGISLRNFSWKWLASLAGFGTRLQLSAWCAVVNRQFDKLLLSRWAGLGFVGSYEISARAVWHVGSIPTLLTAVLLPASSHLAAIGDEARLVRLYRRAQRYGLLVTIPPFLFIAVYAHAVVVAWIGRADPLAVVFVQLLAAGYLVNSFTNAIGFVCQGIGRADIQAKQSVAQLLANVVLSVALFQWLGPYGAALGTSIAMVLGAIYFFRRFHPLLRISTAEILREAALGPLAGAAAGLIAALSTVGFAIEPTTRLEALQLLLAAGVVFSSVYSVICWRAGWIVAADLQLLRGALARRSDERWS